MLSENETRSSYDTQTNLSHISGNLFEDASINSLLNHGGNYTTNIGQVLKVLEDWRNRFNITVVKECDGTEYCAGEFRDLIIAYNSIHGYVSLLLLPGQEDRPYSWAAYMLFHMHFTQIFHTASILLTLSLAVWRYLAIKYPAHSPILCTDRRCTVAIMLSFVLPSILCIPSYFVFTIHKDFSYDRNANVFSKVYFVDSDFDGYLYHINFWVHAVLIKLLPCVILTIISAWLIRALYRANYRKKILKGYNACPAETIVNGKGNIFTRRSTKRSKIERRTDRTTKMLVAVLLLFLLTEFPQGILGLLSGILGRCFFKHCYNLFGELMDALALLNGAINFVLYCSMSRQFRTTFGQMLRTRCAKTYRAGSQTELQTTYV
ncbi:neuropeptide receptor A20 isoform X2 [Bombyx mori]|uniref:G-protein coupled receptors family 1 profile domain-containing protein n=1 Tax=Bombyx mori TaxID=7091 RepID=A0A8R2M368_BOMMO|nr:neuropeptide receptor A20 isoform X2 [Bombyx mori]